MSQNQTGILDTVKRPDGSYEVVLKPQGALASVELAIRAKQPILLRGEAGIGKSAIVAEACRNLHMAMIDLRLGQLSDVDLRGIPTISNGRTVWVPPSFLPNDGNGVIFLDELNRGLTSTQNAAFQLIRDRRLGDYILPPGWSCVGAINPEGSAAGGGTVKMSQALNNRFTHINLVVDVDEWCKWAVGARIEPVVLAFIRFRPNLLHSASRTEYAYPTPRSWEFVSNIVAQAPGPDVELALISGSVGYGAAIEFSAFLRTWRTLPSIDAIMLDPTNAPVPPDVATQYAVATALASRANDGNLGRVLTYLERMAPEYTIFAVKDAVGRDASLQTCPEFTRWAIAHQDYL